MPARRCPPWYFSLVLAVLSTSAWATSQRTFVASFGDDTHPCSITQPCRGFTVAVSKTNPGGEVIVLDSAGYGTVTISKSISIIAPSGVYAGISVAAGNGITINAPGATVVLRGLSINGQGGANGILVQNAARVRIESCVVSSMGAVGIYHQANNAEMIVLDTISRDNGDTGVYVGAGDARIVLDDVRSEHNVNYGFYIAPTSGSTSASAMITDSLFANNGTYGVWADTVGGAVTYISVERSVFTDGNRGVVASAAAAGALVSATLARNTFSTSGVAIYALAPLPGQAFLRVSDNSSMTEFVIDEAGTTMFASGNSAPTLSCHLGATLTTFGNNNTGIDLGACTYSKVGGS